MSELDEVVAEEIAAETPTEEAPKKPATKRLTQAEWLEVEEHWAYGSMSGKEMADKYGISTQAIRAHFKKLMDDGVPIARNSKRHLLAGKSAAAAISGAAATTAGMTVGIFASKRKERIEASKTSIYNQSQINQAMLQKLQRDIADPLTAATSATHDDEFKAILRVERILQVMAKTRWILLDIENDVDEATMPKLIFEDLTQEEIDHHQQGSDDDDGDLDIEVTEDDAEANGVVEEGEE